MAHGEATVVIRRPAKEVLDFVMDLHEYRKIDKKLGVIRWLRRDGDTVTFRFRPWLLGLPGPVTTQRLVRTGDSRIDISPPFPSWQDRLAGFEASFVCHDHPEGTTVTRRLDFTLSPALRWFLDPILTRWLKAEVPREIAAAKARLER